MWKSYFIFLFLIIFCNNTQQQQENKFPFIACRNIFQYVDVGSEVIGLISLPDVGNNVELNVVLAMRTFLHTNYRGKLIQLEPTKYRVEFPITNEIPKLVKITVNGHDICISGGYPTGTTISLNHRSYETEIRTVNRHEPSFEPHPYFQPEIPFRRKTSFRPPTFDQFFEDNVPDPDNFDRFISFIKDSPNIFPSSQHSNTFQQVAKPLQQVTQYPKNTLQITERIPTFKSGSSTVESFNPSANQKCGEESSLGGFIVGGEKFARGKFPWLTAIYYKQSGLRFLCGGSLISPRTVITAGHCFRSSNLKADRLVVELGRHNLEDFVERNYETREIQKLIIHPEYNSNSFSDADLAILHLESSVQYNDFIRPICLWSGPPDTGRIVDHMGVVAGWGGDEFGHTTTALPKKISTNIVSNIECRNFSKVISERTFCAGNRDGTGPCVGDSGSGFMMLRNNRWYIRGVVSGGELKRGTCDLEHYVLFCDIAKHLQWVQSQMIY